jgi:predicted N-formylglutamate amidohydrolase
MGNIYQLCSNCYRMKGRFRKYKLAKVYDVSSRAAKKLIDPTHKNLPSEIEHYGISGENARPNAAMEA